MFWIDIAIFVVLVGYFIVGLVRGFFRSSMRFGNTALALCAGVLLAPTLALLFTNVFHLDTPLSQVISNSISSYCVSDTGTQLDNTYLHKFAELTLGHEYWLDYAGGVESAEFIAKLSYAITDCLMVLFSFFIVFGLMRIIVSFICGFIRSINRKRSYGWIARVSGAFVSLIEGACMVFVTFCVIGSIMPVAPTLHHTIQDILASNPVTNWLFTLTQDFLDAALLPWLMRFYIQI